MVPSPFSRIMLLPLLSTVAAFLPPLVAWHARRWSLREPAGQVALCWLVMAVLGTVQIASLYVVPGMTQNVGYVVVGLFPVLLVPPSLTWVGGAAKRNQWRILALWLVFWGLAATGLPRFREFNVLLDPIMALGMFLVSLWTLSVQVRRPSASPWHSDWFWILLGHVVYFLVVTVRQPIMETLLAHGWSTPHLVYVHNGVLLLYCACYVAIARGLLLPAPEVARSGPTRAPASGPAADVRVTSA